MWLPILFFSKKKPDFKLGEGDQEVQAPGYGMNETRG